MAVTPRRICRFAVLLAAVPTEASASGLAVQTQSGAVSGGSVGAEHEWVGVPFAAPPVGALRWRPPAPVTPWSGVRDATQFAPPCIQPDGNGGTIGSEDCLYLNVFAPSTASAGSDLPVMVHLYPGGNFFGAPYPDASAFTARGVIVVTPAYRLGVLGFMGLPALTAEGGGQSGEYAGLDQLAALQWVHDNIAAFGGNPSNVTLFGSSAGALDTLALMNSPLSHGLITRAALESNWLPALTGGVGTYTVGAAEQFGTSLANAVECGSSSDVLACMRAAPASSLVATASANGMPDFDTPPLGSSVLPQTPLQLASQGSPVPLLIGFDREEQAFFFFPLNAVSPPPFSYSDWVKNTVNLVGPNFAAGARALYPPSAYDSPLWDYLTMWTDLTRGCPARRLANLVATRAPVWRYLYTHVYENDPPNALLRAGHIMEDELLWGYDVDGFGHVLTPAEQVLSGQMTDYWTNFAKTGNPNGPGLRTWPAYNTTSEPTLTLDDQIGGINNYHDQQCALLDTVPEPFPPPWANGVGPTAFPFGPPGFNNGHARAIP